MKELASKKTQQVILEGKHRTLKLKETYTFTLDEICKVANFPLNNCRSAVISDVIIDRFF